MSEEEKKTEEEKKIIIDEDWKGRVEAEREEAKKQEEMGAQPEETETAQTESAGPAEPLPPPSLTFLCSSLYLQAMIALGVVQNPVSQKTEANIEQAKHAIDTLTMLQEKTEGNRTDEETADIERMLHELRMGFVSVKQQQEGRTE